MLNFPGSGSFVGQEKYRIPDQEGNDLKWQIRFPQRCGLLAVSPKCIVLSLQTSLPSPENSFSPSWAQLYSAHLD